MMNRGGLIKFADVLASDRPSGENVYMGDDTPNSRIPEASVENSTRQSSIVKVIFRRFRFLFPYKIYSFFCLT